MSDWVEHLKQLGELRDNGSLSEAEFESAKRRILEDREIQTPNTAPASNEKRREESQNPPAQHTPHIQEYTVHSPAMNLARTEREGQADWKQRAGTFWDGQSPTGRRWIIGVAVVAVLLVIGGISSAVRSGSSSDPPYRNSVNLTSTTQQDNSGSDSCWGYLDNKLGGDNEADCLMPNVICMGLQEAQDEIQDRGVFFSRSEDATGQGRMQLWDRNWIVIRQSPRAGTPIDEGDAILYVMKKSENHGC